MNVEKTRRTIAAWTAAAVVIGVPALAAAQGSGAVVPLPAQMQQAAQTYLPGVVGAPVPSFLITPNMASLQAGSRTYTVVSGPDAGSTETHVIAPLKGDKSGAQWHYTVGQRSAYLKLVPGESLSIVAETDADQGVITRYSPPLPLLVAGMQAGDSKQMTLQVSVFDLTDPTDQTHSGSLNTTLTYVGAYQVTVPAGTFNAALLRWSFNGTIGPATVEDIQARFVSPYVGMVAAAEKRDVAAFLIYNDNTKIGRALAQRP